jgi:hypothetical protein
VRQHVHGAQAYDRDALYEARAGNWIRHLIVVASAVVALTGTTVPLARMAANNSRGVMVMAPPTDRIA